MMVGNPALMQVSVEEIETHKQRNGRFLFFFSLLKSVSKCVIYI